MTVTPALPLAAAIAWVGHACVWTCALNVAYSRRVTKLVLRPFRLFCGLVIVGFPAVAHFRDTPAVLAYLAACLAIGGIAFPAITLYRLLRKPPPALLARESRFLDYWGRLGRACVGDGRYPWATRLPLTDAFTVELTSLALRPEGLPAAWDGLTMLVLSDLHFHGTPSRAFYDALFADLRALPRPDLVLLVGDFLDSDAHHGWIGELLGPLDATEGRFALLGNHDIDHAPDRVRQELEYAGYTAVGRRPARVTIRGVECAVVGHEGPWFPPPTGVAELPPDLVKLGLSHSPDNVGWARRNGIPLLFCGHVHGGQIRLPVIGPIFVPSLYSRRYDGGVYQSGPTTLVVGRGLSGKEPLRFRCLPQVLRVTIKTRG